MDHDEQMLQALEREAARPTGCRNVEVDGEVVGIACYGPNLGGAMRDEWDRRIELDQVDEPGSEWGA